MDSFLPKARYLRPASSGGQTPLRLTLQVLSRQPHILEQHQHQRCSNLRRPRELSVLQSDMLSTRVICRSRLGIPAPCSCPRASPQLLHRSSGRPFSSSARCSATVPPPDSSGNKSPKAQTVKTQSPVIQPKDAKKPSAAPQSLLAEEKGTNREQRKADWAIMKEMAKYLWPKASYNVTLCFSFRS